MIRNAKIAAFVIAAAAFGAAPLTIATDASAQVVRDHRTKPDVRDHRTGGPDIRDHRKGGGRNDVSDSPGGVKVTNSGGSRGCRAQVCATGNERPGRGRWQPN